MNKDFWERLKRLEELAGKATKGHWHKIDIEYEYSVVSIDEQDDNGSILIEPIREKDAAFISAANPVMILEMSAKLRRLEKEADWLAKELGECNREGSRECSYPFQHEKCCVCWRESARKGVRDELNACVAEEIS